MSKATRIWSKGLAKVVISSAAGAYVASQAAQTAVPTLRSVDMLEIGCKVMLFSGLANLFAFLQRSPLPPDETEAAK